MLGRIMALLTAYGPICDSFCWARKEMVYVRVCVREGVWRANSLDLLRRSFNLHSCPVNESVPQRVCGCCGCFSMRLWLHTHTHTHTQKWCEQWCYQSQPCYAAKNGRAKVWRSLMLPTKNSGSCWGCMGGVWGNGYLSFVAKCVSNPVSCVALGESDPPWPCDPAVLLCLLTLKMTHN